MCLNLNVKVKIYDLTHKKWNINAMIEEINTYKHKCYKQLINAPFNLEQNGILVLLCRKYYCMYSTCHTNAFVLGELKWGESDLLRVRPVHLH